MNKIIYFLKYLNYYRKQKNEYNISFFKCVKAFFKGFTPFEYYLFDFDNNDINDYLSEFKRLYYRKKLNEPQYTVLLDNKLLFKLFFQHYFNVSPVIFWKFNNKLFDAKSNEISIDELFNGLNGIYFVKPLTDGGGTGVIKITCDKNRYFINEKKSLLNEIKKELENRKCFIIEPYVKQAEYSDNIYSESANTIRIITMKDNNGEIIMSKACHRFGTEMSKPTDNFSRHGLACNIDIDTGELQKCKYFSPNGIKFVDTHPNTNSKIRGVKIPNWNNLKKIIIDNHYKVYYLNYIAWDVLITNDGYRIIEANASCGSKILQLENGIKKNKDIYDFYKRIGAFK